MKISIYANEEQKIRLEALSEEANLSMSAYLLQKGLDHQITSNQFKAEAASIACRLYAIADDISDKSQKENIRRLAGELYGILED